MNPSVVVAFISTVPLMRTLGITLALLTPIAAAVTALGSTGAETAAAQGDIESLLAESGVKLDRTAGLCGIPASSVVVDELLEYVLVGPGGALHETLLSTAVRPSLLNAALLLLGVEPGRNAVWTPVDPPPTHEERRAGAKPYTVELPSGDGFFLYVAWRVGEERYVFRLEDLITNLRRGRSMERHRWVYLGSRFLEPGESGGDPVFAADREGNLIALTFFEQGNTLLTGALHACLEQSIWVANRWLLPPPGSDVQLVFSKERRAALPDDWELPEVTSEPAPSREDS